MLYEVITRVAREEEAEVVEPDEGVAAVLGPVEREVERAEQRDDHDRRVDQHRRCQEHADMPARHLPLV